MPLSGYSHHTDPETGDLTLLPDLTGREITYSSEQLLEWIKVGTIPEDMGKILLEQMEIARNYKSIHDALGKLGQEGLKNKWLKAKEATDFLIANKGALLGSKILEDTFRCIKPTDPDIEWLATIKEAMTSISSTDPLPIHFLTARTFLKESHSIEAPEAVDILTRKLVEHCVRIKEFKTFRHPVFIKHPIDPKDLNEHFEDEKGGILSLDSDLINYFAKLGKKGKEASKQLAKNSRDLYSIYEKSNYSSDHRLAVWSLWTPKENGISPFLALLARVEWESSVSTLWNRKSQQMSALTRPILQVIKPLLNSKGNKKFITSKEEWTCVDERGASLITAPTIDAGMIALLQKGVKSLETLTGHRLLRWQINTGFEKWSAGEADPRSIVIEGGYSAISKAAGCLSEHERGKIKAILHAQAHGVFVFPNGSKGNMISLCVLEKHKNNEPSKINIVLGEMLLPTYVFNITDKRNRRLIPIGDLPPFSGSKNTHSNQAFLQLLVFEEFSQQSDALAKNGAVIISKEMWVDMAKASGLDPKKIGEIIENWCRPDLFNCFLDQQGDEYRLASHFERAQKFLISQGKTRNTNSERGKASVVQRRAKSKKQVSVRMHNP